MNSKNSVLICGLALGGCATSRPAPSPILVDVEPGAVTLCEAERAVVQVRVAWLGEGPSPDGPPDVSWRSENRRVASVDETGVITGGRAGTATLVGQVAWGRFQTERRVSVTVNVGRVAAQNARRVRLAGEPAPECNPAP